MSKYGIRFNSPHIEKFNIAEPERILICLNQLKMQQCKVIFYILNETGGCIYHLIKFLQNWRTGKMHFYYSIR